MLCLQELPRGRFEAPKREGRRRGCQELPARVGGGFGWAALVVASAGVGGGSVPKGGGGPLLRGNNVLFGHRDQRSRCSETASINLHTVFMLPRSMQDGTPAGFENRTLRFWAHSGQRRYNTTFKPHQPFQAAKMKAIRFGVASLNVRPEVHHIRKRDVHGQAKDFGFHRCFPQKGVMCPHNR